MMKFNAVLLCMFIFCAGVMWIVSVEIKAILIKRACYNHDTECDGNRITKVAADSSDMDLKPESADGKFNLFHAILFAKNCGDQNCSRLSAAARLPQTTDMSSSTKFPVYPAIFSLGPADNINNNIDENNRVLHSVKRYPQACNYTVEPITNAVITCYVWPNSIRCEIACVHGFAIKEGEKILKKTERKCRETEIYWYPYPSFPRCLPYINCRTNLIGPGFLSCNTSNSVNSPGYCDVTCHGDYQHIGVPTARYECVDEKYGKILPFCAAPDNSEKLIGHPTNV